jgi:hypothetical protein
MVVAPRRVAKPVPVMVTFDPIRREPRDGLTAVTVGARATMRRIPALAVWAWGSESVRETVRWKRPSYGRRL